MIKLQKEHIKQLGRVTALSLPVLIYIWKFSVANRHGIFVGEDWDYFTQAYEAARITILHYHQFPWWNPWSVGGDPLFANPQFGLFSFPMLLVLLFGTVVGLHLSIAVYFLLGFWGMYLLLGRLGANSKVLQALLSYIWVFSGFPAWHLSGGHFTFAVYLLSPWLFLTLVNIRRKRGWIWFGLMASVLINTATHYLTIQALLIASALAVFEIVRRYKLDKKPLRDNWWPLAKPYVYAGCIIIVLSGFKLAYTLQYSHEFPRLDAQDDKYVPFAMLVAAITTRHSVNPLDFFRAQWGWGEYADYFGLITLTLAAYTTVKYALQVRLVRYREWFLLAGIAFCALLYMGSFASFSPFHVLQQLPIFNQMRVPSRYVSWLAFGVIVLLRNLPARKVIYILLIVSALDVWAANYRIMSYPQKPYTPPATASNMFQEYAYYDTHGAKDVMRLGIFRLLRATQSNIGEVYGYEPAIGLGEYANPRTIRCGINQGCPFVMSHNAHVDYWSPGKIILTRTGSGPVELSMNPGKVWHVNGKPAFPYYRVLEISKPFVITNPSKHLIVSFSPTL